MEQRNVGVIPEFTEEERPDLHGKWKGLKRPKDCVCLCVCMCQCKKDRAGRMSSADPVFNHKVAPKSLEF